MAVIHSYNMLFLVVNHLQSYKEKPRCFPIAHCKDQQQVVLHQPMLYCSGLQEFSFFFVFPIYISLSPFHGNDPGRHSPNNGIIRYIVCDNCICPYGDIVTDFDCTNYLRSRTYIHFIANNRDTCFFAPVGHSYSYPLRNIYVIADDSPLVNHNTAEMSNIKTFSNLS